MQKSHKKIELTARERTVMGRAVRHLRQNGFVPAVLYGKGLESKPLQIPVKEFENVFKTSGESTLVYLHVGNSVPVPTIIHDVARDPLDGGFLHADFYKVRLDEKIKAKISVTFSGESPAVKNLAGIFVRNANELEVEALPQDLPPEISVDISGLAQFGDQILAKDVKLPSGVKLLAENEEIIATIQEPKSEAELAAELAQPTTDVSAVEEIEKEKPAEEVPAEESGAAPTPEAKSEKPAKK